MGRLLSKLLGSDFVESSLAKCLLWSAEAKFRNAWQYSAEPPHFFSQQINLIRMLGDTQSGAGWLLRGVYAWEIIKEGDTVLDIGCGDGFFTKHFLSAKAKHVDAVDIDASAIHEANSRNSSSKIAYHMLDAAKQPFPRKRYDVIVWDGAIGHFDRRSAADVIRQVASALASLGTFCGSESLGSEEGSDHLQFFKEPNDLAELLSAHFGSIYTRVAEYRLGNGFQRREVFWRAVLDADQPECGEWRRSPVSSI